MEMKNKIRHLSVPFILAGLVLGCGFLGGDKIENGIINDDLGKQELAVTEGTASTWDFSRDQGRCFDVLESKFEGDKAVITISVGSYYESEGVPDSVFTVFGKVVMNYRRDGKTWTLEKAEGKELIGSILSLDKFKEFLEISAPLCRNYRATLKGPE